MADDGMLMNFDLGDITLLPKPKFQGGRWKDRLVAKKRANERTKRIYAGPTNRPIFNEKTYRDAEEDYIGSGTSEPLYKRQRIEAPLVGGPRVSNSTHLSYRTGKLPRGSINTPSSQSAILRSVEELVTPSIQVSNDGIQNTPHPKSKPSLISRNFLPGSRAISATTRSDNLKEEGVISSLFSFNPVAKTKFDDQSQNVEPTKASNAPLTDEISTFTTLGLSVRLATHLSTKLGLEAPTGVQKAAIPAMLTDDSDAFIQAETGSGKTLAYLLPIVNRIVGMSGENVKVHRDSGLFAIILAPTRELCKQIASVLEKLLRCAPWVVGTSVIGGDSKQSEKARLRKGVNILIATPGRLADHLENTEVLDVKFVRWLVLDEGDRLMELGFEEEIKGIVDIISRRSKAYSIELSKRKMLPIRRVTVLCSATMKMNVQRLGEISLKDAVHIRAHPSEILLEDNSKSNLSTNETPFTAPAQLKQAYAIVPAKLRLVTLVAVLKRTYARKGSATKTIVFLSCADSVDFHFSLFSRPTRIGDSETPPKISSKTDLTKDTVAPAMSMSNNQSCVVLHKLHGSLAQNIRTATLKAFADSTEPCIMVCTDVASRGLDLPNIDYVIEYDPPFSSDDHLHRVGRTARAGKSGRALIFLLPGSEEEYVSVLAAGYHDGKSSLASYRAEELLLKGFGGTGREWEDRATDYQLEVERWALESPKYLEMARRAYQSHIRAYATHVASERPIFNMHTLHLGHLAKAFALRDRPGSIRVPGLRPAKMTKADRSVAARKAKRGDQADDILPEGERVRKQRKLDLDLPAINNSDASRRMKRKMQEHFASTNEFNIG